MMQPFPHRYEVEAGATVIGDVTVQSERLPSLKSAAPAEFGGPGDRWSPETLLVGAVADCFALTFRAIAAGSQLPWTSLTCEAVGTVERVERVTRFTEVTVRARLQVPDGTDETKARRLLEKTEQSCLISNSLKATVHLEAEVQTVRERQREGKVCMTDKNMGVQPMEDPEAQLERAFIDEYLKLHGHDPAAVRSLPEAQVITLLEGASIYAAGRLAEFESRAHYVHDIHGKD